MFSLTPSMENPLIAKGIQFKLENGYTVSVQWGSGNYCDNYHHRLKGVGERMPDSTTAETAIFNSDNQFINYKGDDVQAHQTVEDVIKTLALVASWPKE